MRDKKVIGGVKLSLAKEWIEQRGIVLICWRDKILIKTNVYYLFF